VWLGGCESRCAEKRELHKLHFEDLFVGTDVHCSLVTDICCFFFPKSSVANHKIVVRLRSGDWSKKRETVSIPKP
jgi:hypothetical protein